MAYKREDKPEYVLCAAIHYEDGKEYAHQPRNLVTGLAVSGWRHHNCFITLATCFPDRSYIGDDKLTQGFLTSKGNFLNREEAAALAFASGQTTEPLTRLFSEDVWG